MSNSLAAIAAPLSTGAFARSSSPAAFGPLRGTSSAMQETCHLLERAAASAATTLLEGETGTGKSVAALAIHRSSDRAAGPFVVVDCGAIAPTLLESELFGHERGAFTGAEARRIGAFEEASGGTLFLDEVGELSPALQPKLLGALENRSIRRVGGVGATRVDVRVVAATNRELRRETSAGHFRLDLYYRLAVIRIEMPALRERPEDIPAIARRLLQELGASERVIEAFLGREVLERLSRSGWPGNVRELRNYLERCLALGGVVPLEPVQPLGSPDISLPFGRARREAIDEFERAYLARILAAHGNQVTVAAAAAGIDRTHFHRLVRKHRLGRALPSGQGTAARR